MNEFEYDNWLSDMDSLEGVGMAGYEETLKEEEVSVENLAYHFPFLSDEEKKAVDYILKYGPRRGTVADLEDNVDSAEDLLDNVMDAYLDVMADCGEDNAQAQADYDDLYPSLPGLPLP